ncbi:DUF4112 domain-containing protein [Baaleninema simplex]|uniref:DUF4112 domain-containing protein n=1 Tax=Baaleninema simplex TaxID=2862350 RepID=UPI00034C05D5|nr:DUF4112 domain-containing protein [Baaleninema simplex]
MPASHKPPQRHRDNTQTVRQLRRLSHLLDNAIAIPGTPYRFGLDPIIGMVPGGGDVVGALLSAYIILQSARLGLPKASLGRMFVNVLLEMLLGVVPVLGDLFDFAWKANAKNVELLESHVRAPRESSTADVRFAVFLGLVLVVVAVLLIVASVSVLWELLQLLGRGFG